MADFKKTWRKGIVNSTEIVVACAKQSIEDEKRFMDEMWETPSGDFAKTDIDCVVLGESSLPQAVRNRRD